MSLQKLEDSIVKIINGNTGVFAVAYLSLSDENDSLLINADSDFHAASTMKTPVMIEVFKQAEKGKFSLNDKLILKNEFKSIVDGSLYSMDIGEDSGDSLYSLLGSEISIRDLIFEMITVSSNLATNILIDLVGAENVTNTMRELGAGKINVLRGVEDTKAFRLGLNNTTTARDLMNIFRAIALGKAVSPAACAEMTEILLQQKFKDKIPGKLPAEVKTAHKTGSITGVQHDSGIVYLPGGGSYVLILLSQKLDSAAKGIEILSDISKLVYDHFTGGKN